MINYSEVFVMSVFSTRAVLNIRFVSASVLNTELNSLFVFGQVVLQDQIRTSCRRAAATIGPRPSPRPVGAKAPCTYERVSHSQHVPHAHRCSRLTRQHGGEQSGLVTLTFDLLTLKVVSESRVTWATPVPILVFLGLSVLDLGPMYVTDKQTSDRHTSDGTIA